MIGACKTAIRRLSKGRSVLCFYPDMTGSQIRPPNTITYTLDDLVANILSGGVRIPDFQRGFRWQWEDVRLLIDSIIRGYPIGSVLLWQKAAPGQALLIGAIRIDAPRDANALWVVDGQQRLTSLANALSYEGFGDSRFGLSYDLARKSLVKPAREQAHLIELAVIFDLQRLLKWFSEHPESIQYLEEATRIAKAIRQYTIPAYIVDQGGDEILKDIFDRINNYGKCLTHAEVFHALYTTTAAGESRSQTLEGISLEIKLEFLFGNIDSNTILRSILARRAPDVTRDIRAEFEDSKSRDFPGEAPGDAYLQGGKALAKAVSFLQKEAGVPHFSFLSYRYLLVVLARFFAHHPDPSPRNIELLKRWFWRASVIGPGVFNGWMQASRILCAQVMPGSESDSVQRLLSSLTDYKLSIPSISKFNSRASSTRIILCAMWSLGPRSFLNGELYSQESMGKLLEDSQTATGIVCAIEPNADSTLTANRFIFLDDTSTEVARECFVAKPCDIDESAWFKFLQSHSIGQQSMIDLSSNNINGFLERREASLRSLTASFLGSMTEAEFEDTPPLASLIIDEDEEEQGAELAGEEDG